MKCIEKIYALPTRFYHETVHIHDAIDRPSRWKWIEEHVISLLHGTCGKAGVRKDEPVPP
ncbi:MAG: hypothetical protein KAQ71_07720 [Desulfobulbaceae bacterium]|nr:hypothetical protein [Desulfobulbaceae bacterium]